MSIGRGIYEHSPADVAAISTPMPEVIEYVVGFCFDERAEKVVLVEKKKPAWQAGHLNGVGGKVEDGESPLQAMRREFKEEAGVHVGAWEHYATIKTAYNPRVSGGAVVHFFRAFSDNAVSLSSTQPVPDESHEPEPIGWYHCSPRLAESSPLYFTNFKHRPNLRWLIPMALSMNDESARCDAFEIQEVKK